MRPGHISRAVMSAVAVNDDGKREVQGIATGLSEAKTFWMERLRSLADRGPHPSRGWLAEGIHSIGALNARDTQESNEDDCPSHMDLMGWTWFDPDPLHLLWRSPGAYEGFHTPEPGKIFENMRIMVDPASA